jgi:hypothetical protein
MISPDKKDEGEFYFNMGGGISRVDSALGSQRYIQSKISSLPFRERIRVPHF